MASWGAEAQIQEWLPGRRDAVSFVTSRGSVCARFAQTSHREYPVLGGVSVLTESIPLLEDIVRPAERLIREFGLEGPSMVEFRRDACDRPVLMEINPRMGGSVNLAVRSGVNIPALTLAWALGKPLERIQSYPVGRRIRWLSGDVWHLKTALGHDRNLDVPRRATAAKSFITDFVLRPSALDPFDISDPIPALVDWKENIIRPVMRRVDKVTSKILSPAKKVVDS
jgi:predicted ATP-grasp superfamily ATP-dependent carboligase